MWLTFSLLTATSKDCAQQMDLLNVLIVLLKPFVHLHEQTLYGDWGHSSEQNRALQLKRIKM